ncbi:MAG TPA: flagellar biosynthesis protein FlhF, partial [Nevskiaceae bacterium]|nr:flagellar biosynthesis protein FlhF [Nevskiaceae bacterium]
GLRQLMQQHIAGLAWNDLKQRNPARADVLRQLSAIGVDLKLAREIAEELPDDATPERAHHLPSSLLARRIPVFKHEWLEAGGVIALVGATGVGKTTTIAKLAARYVRDYGLRDVALVTTDHFRIGAQEQLFTYGRLLGVPVLTADNQHELCLALDKLKDRKLVLIDTAGMSPRDSNLESQFAMLSGLPVPNRTALVLAANSHGADLDDQVRRFARAEPSACILTKLDEATRVGAAISTLIRNGLPLAYTTDGQRVPEDLWAADADRLVLWAMQLSRRGAEPDEEELSLQMSGAAHA